MMPMHSGAMGYSSHSNSTSSTPSGTGTGTGTSSGAKNNNTNVNNSLSSSFRDEFDFPTVTLPPRLKDFGRKISQISDNFLPPSGTGPNSPDERTSQLSNVVPFMGDDPVMCPFCNKPLPPSLLASQLTSHNHNSNNNNNNNRIVRRDSRPPVSRRTSDAISRAPTPRATSRVTTPQQTLLDPLPVTTPVPKTTSEELEPTVREGDTANHSAAETIISEEELQRWSAFTGVPPASANKPVPTIPAPAPITPSAPAKTEKAFPLLPPPPGSTKLTKASPIARQPSPSRFGIFGKSKAVEEDESDEDGAVGGGGYSRLVAPGSPSDDEDGNRKTKPVPVKEEKKVDGSSKANVISDQHVDEPAEIESKNLDAIAEPAKPAEDSKINASGEELRTVLQEVLGRVNQLTKSHNDLLSSHSTLLTSLKIARSNLAMAEANSEMLEAQIKRAAAIAPASIASPAPPATSNTSRAVSGPARASTPTITSVPTAVQKATPTATAPPTSRASADQVRVPATAAAKPTASMAPPVAAPVPKRISLDEKRPTMLHLTANDLAHSGGGPQSASAGSDASKAAWGFWNGGKKRVSGALNSVGVPSPAAVMAALPSSRPGTPSTERGGFDIGSWIPNSPASASAYAAFAPIEAPRSPQARNTQTTLSRSMGQQPTLSRSVSQHVVSTSKPSSSSNASSRTTQVPVSELSKLRQAYSAAVAKMDGMSKELAELKKGKVEMEAELENLSQALFEEANKMVADERRKKAELEENLKEVKEEREALRQTIKVLGGKVEEEEQRASLDIRTSNKTGETARPETEFAPRDLDKHYEALRKAVHHVADGATDINADTETDTEDEDNGNVNLLSQSVSSLNDLPVPTSATHMTSSVPNLQLDSIREGDAPSIPGLSMSLPAENNPWASSPRVGTGNEAGLGLGMGTGLNLKMTVTTPSPIPEAQDLVSEAEGEGEGEGDTSGEGQVQAPMDIPTPQPVGLGLALGDKR